LSIKKFILIGSGISSLTLALLLLKEGHQVTILEQHYVPGGYLHCFKRFGFKYETGAHYVGALGKDLPFYRLLNYLGVYHAEDFVELSAHDLDIYYFEDFQFSYTLGYKQNIYRLTEQFPQNKEQIEQYFSLVEQAAHSFPTYYFKREYNEQKMLGYLEVTLEQVLNDLSIQGRLRKILEAPCILHGVSPKEISFGIHSILIDSITISAHGFKNGGQALAQRFVDKIIERGGEIKLSHKVTEIRLKESFITEVVCENGAEFSGDEYISGIHPKILFEMIGLEKLRTSFRHRLQKIPESCPFVGAYLTLKNNLTLNPHSNYFFIPEQLLYKEQEVTLENQFGFMATSDRSYSGNSKFPLAIHASCPPHYFEKWKSITSKITEKEYIKAKENIFTPLLKKIDQKIEGFSHSIVDICYSSTLTNSRFNPSPNGSAYGFYHDRSVTGARSLGPKTQFSNLYLTGQNTLFPGILGASVSGLRTCSYFTGMSTILKRIEY